MKQEAKQLRDRVSQLSEELLRAEKDLGNFVRSCQHQYSATVYDPIYTSAYTIPGDPPGTMGIDWRGPTYVSAHTEDRWRRICESCGEIEYTSRIKQEIKKIPYWPKDDGEQK